jgi:hypothetical protein
MPLSAMAELVYGHPSDNVLRLGGGTLTQSTGTTDPLYPVTNAIDDDPANPTYSTGTGDYALQWAFGGATRVDLVWIPMHNFPAGTVIRFEGNNGAAWGAPTLSKTYTVLPYRGDMPRGIFLDLTTVAGYTTSGFTHWRLFVPNPGKITGVGEVYGISTKRTTRNLFRGVQRPRIRTRIRHPRADGGWFRYDRGTVPRPIQGEVRANTTVYAAYLALWEDCTDGGDFYFPVVLDSHLDDPEGLVMLWESDISPTNVHAVHEMLEVVWSEAPRGRALV